MPTHPRTSIASSGSRPTPLAISFNNNESIEHTISYSANQDDLRRRSNQLARLALRAESASIRSSTLTDHSSYGDTPPRINPENIQNTQEMNSSQVLQQTSSTQPVIKIQPPDERSPFYFGHYYDTQAPSAEPNNLYGTLPKPIANSRSKQSRPILRFAQDLVGTFPAVILGLMMNVLDGVSYGLIMFPTGAGITTFDGFGGIGISMFFMTCIVSQLVYSLGASAFPGGNGSMMIESVPFMHVIAKKIIKGIGPEHPEEIIATTMVSFAMSSILTGVAFFGLGALKLGNLMGFFPRHILVGCIGSVGAFLMVTGIAVTGHLDDGFSFSGSTLHHLIRANILPLWLVPLGLAVALRVLTSFFNQPFVVPTYFLTIPFLFYGITTMAGIHLGTLRSTGWVFDINLSENTSPFAFYSLFKFHAVDWKVLKTTLMEQVAMVIFGLLHVPLNVPALALSLGKDDVDINKELIAHGISNTLAGLTGTVSNYLCYVNSVLFARVGGDSRLAGAVLAIVMMGVFAVGPGVIAYLPICVVGALIYVLGIDLLKEAVWDTWGKVSWVEYGTIWAIIIAATWHDFVVGLIVGVLLACMSFVVTSSQHKPIRSVMDGCTARSTVRRHPTQHAFLKRVGMKTRVIKLQGHLFFGTISACEQLIKSILQSADKQSIQFLVVDFSSTASIDFSAVEAFLRIHRLLLSKSIVFVICGTANQVSKALRSVGLWSRDSIEVFEHLNQALEHCENVYLRNLYFRGESDHPRTALANSQYGLVVPRGSSPEVASPSPSPRRSFRASASARKKATPNNEARSLADMDTDAFNMARSILQPLPLLLQTFRPFLPDENESFWLQIAPYFQRVEFKRELPIWRIGTKADCFYLIQSGILKASYAWPTLLPLKNDASMTTQSLGRKTQIEESMLPGTVAGDHTFLAQLDRNTNVTAETDAILWKMDRASWAKIDIHSREIIGIGLLKMAAVEEEVLIGHLFTRF
ncbi:hypothetical protein PtA15_4A881 [Puccinia triticina]|uniref:STAS domain-containing protein n=1 Tax=Puccinia triticina TaxID=208348 RepID=A0ABY7CGU4_9BASI|nr:uncharacterized protein PtA15_4A881 [Puccinia triticina]WAQ84428.1 hypothetical protein PtA15_4A881 [Puccinia triticina]WAR55260.1 hypothetical protein PtB15_4B880 [Puccinia triticina]